MTTLLAVVGVVYFVASVIALSVDGARPPGNRVGTQAAFPTMGQTCFVITAVLLLFSACFLLNIFIGLAGRVLLFVWIQLRTIL